MPDADANTIISLCSNLEPIAGNSFALNLAYIGLPRFRYRETISEKVSKAMGELKDAPEKTKDTGWYKALARLASLHESPRKLFHKSDKNAELTGAWSWFYEKLFECHQDRIITIFGSFFSAIIVLFGVLHSTKASTAGDYLFIYPIILNWIILIVIFQILPVIFVIAGWYVTKRAIAFAEKNIADIKKTMQTEAANASVVVTQPRHPPLPSFRPLTKT